MLEVKKAKEKNQKRFVLVHGLCHGMWTCYKVKAQLEAASRRLQVTTFPFPQWIWLHQEEIETLKDYCKPLLELVSSLCSDKVILVAHSMGGISAAFAGDIFPHTIAAFVYLTAFMPDKETHLLIMFYNRGPLVSKVTDPSHLYILYAERTLQYLRITSVG
ncbi:hypothetical protein YC2023_046270 [Brassica napus]